MDYIHIENLSFSGKHGVYENERRLEQEFVVSVKLSFDTHQAGNTDELSDTVDYSAVKSAVQETIEGNSRYLIERLAEDIATKILTDARIHSVEVTIKKVAVWKNGIPGVTIVRSR